MNSTKISFLLVWHKESIYKIDLQSNHLDSLKNYL